MDQFKQIIKFRDEGKSHKEIASILGLSRKTISRYLKEGKIPVYNRNQKSNRTDPMLGFYEIAQEKITQNPAILMDDLFEYLSLKGYSGSSRTLRRKTLDFRKKAKNKEIFFQREVKAGEIMEGDFTEILIDIGGKTKKLYIWVTSLPFSNTFHAKAYYHCSFESFSDASVNAFEYFGGVAKKYRLDNMSPVVSKVLMGKDRVITQRYASFQSHYEFKQDFCNPAKGNEKGNVEANNKHLKRKIKSQISLYKLSFVSLESFNEFLFELCVDHNRKCEDKMSQEDLSPLPATQFKSFRSEVVSVSKYSTFTVSSYGHLYSVPSQYIGLSLEARIYPEKIEVFHESKKVTTHKRVFGVRGLTSIKVEHIINGLIKKPGAMKDWKHREVLFERPAWKSFYEKLKSKNFSDKEYLKCLKLINEYGKELVSASMEIVISEKMSPDSLSLVSILTNEMSNVSEFKPIKTNLAQYDQFLNGGKVNE